MLLVPRGAARRAAGSGLGSAVWCRAACSTSAPLLVAVELAVLRAAAAWVRCRRPRRPGRAPRWAAWLAGLLQPACLRPRRASPNGAASDPGSKQSSELDFSRSGQLGFMRRALPPVGLLMLVVGWGLTGVTGSKLDQRGSYERFGAPGAMLRPGLHLVLPWPLGGCAASNTAWCTRSELRRRRRRPITPAEGPAPASANRLWDKAQRPRSPNHRQPARACRSFQTVSADLRVLYRIGMDDAGGRALYGAVDPEQLVRTARRPPARPLLRRSHLADVLGEDREQVADGLRRAICSAARPLLGGVEIVA